MPAAVPGNENAPDGRFAGLRYGGVALRRERQERGEALKLRLLPDGDKKTVHAKLGLFAGRGIFQPQRAERAVLREKSGDLHRREDCNVLSREEARLLLGVAAEGVGDGG